MKYRRCPICNCEKIEYELNVKDWEFGSKNKYKYVKCNECGCLYREISKFKNEEIYDSSTYSTLKNRIIELEPKKGLKGKIIDELKRIRNQYSYFNKSLIFGRFLSKLYPVMHPYLQDYSSFFRNNISFLDVGAGTGKLAYELREAGIDAHAIEPYLQQDILYKNGLDVKKMFISDVMRKYDVVFLNNVFEHLEEPEFVLKEIGRILNDGGVCGIVIPGYGRMTDIYKENSYVLQAPQHYCIYSEKGIKQLADTTGFKILSLKRCVKEEWYVKSYLLKNNILFDEKMTLKQLKKLLSNEGKREVNHECDDVRSRKEGDWYHVMLTKEN